MAIIDGGWDVRSFTTAGSGERRVLFGREGSRQFDGLGGIHNFLWALREARRGEAERSHRRLSQLGAPERRLLGIPLGRLCAALSERIERVCPPRTAEACIRFYGLGRMPENLATIAVPHESNYALSLSRRRIRQLVAAAEQQLAEDLRREPLVVAGGLSVGSVDAFFTDAQRWECLRALFWGWADVPDSDQRSAEALVLFEREMGLLPASNPSSRLQPPIHREHRRRLRRRAEAILAVAIERSTSIGARESAGALVDTTSDRLLGPKLVVAACSPTVSLEATLSRLLHGPCAVDELVAACQQVHHLVQSGSPHAAVLLGALRHQLVSSPECLPASLTAKTLAASVVQARLRDDPSGIPSASAALHLVRSQLPLSRDKAEARQLTSSGLRTLQAAAELYGRLGLTIPALRATTEAFRLLSQCSDTEPEGWRQQLLLSRALILQAAARQMDDPQPWLRAAQVNANESAMISRRHGLPDEWRMSAEAVLGEALVDEALAHRRRGDTPAKCDVLVRARSLLARSQLEWMEYGIPELVTSKSSRLTVLRSAASVAIMTKEADAYLRIRRMVRKTTGPWLLPADVEALNDMERQAAQCGIAPQHLAAEAVPDADVIGQRVWARGLALGRPSDEGCDGPRHVFEQSSHWRL